MLSPQTLAELQDVLDAIESSTELSDGVRTNSDIQRLHGAITHELTNRDPTSEIVSDLSIDRPTFDARTAEEAVAHSE